MSAKRIVSIVLLILGVGFYIFGTYIESEVTQGEKKIANAQGMVDKGKSLTDITPFTKGIGDMATSSAQKKIDEGKEKAHNYQILANWLHGSGIGLFVIGAILLGVSFIRPKKAH